MGAETPAENGGIGIANLDADGAGRESSGGQQALRHGHALTAQPSRRAAAIQPRPPGAEAAATQAGCLRQVSDREGRIIDTIAGHGRGSGESLGGFSRTVAPGLANQRQQQSGQGMGGFGSGQGAALPPLPGQARQGGAEFAGQRRRNQGRQATAEGGKIIGLEEAPPRAELVLVGAGVRMVPPLGFEAHVEVHPGRSIAAGRAEVRKLSGLDQIGCPHWHRDGSTIDH